MAEFAYKALNPKNQHVSGMIVAATREEAVKNLRDQGNKPLSVKEAKAAGRKLSIGKGKVKLKDLVIFTRELSTMISAGVPLPRALDTLANQIDNKYFKEVINGINHDVESGAPLADAMARYPSDFSDVYINMVRAGEAGGILDEILKRLAEQVEKDASIRKKIHSAMAYPMVILTVTVIAFFGIMLFILPKIGKIITDLGGPDAKLPVYSRAMLGASSFMQHNIIFILIILGGIVFGFRHYIHTEEGRYKWHGLLLRLPIVGNIVSKVAIARFSRTFSSLMGSGVSVLEALEVTGKAVGNKVIQKELVDIAEQVKNGQPLGKQMLEAKFFPPIVGQMMTVGEETGKIDQILIKVADFYEEEVDAVIDGLASIIEPLMIVVLGSVVGLIAASVMGPIASLSKNIGNN
jgi:type IV pilus assembly protein PilC